MRIIFEIPIYGIAPDVLRNRYFEKKKSIVVECRKRNVSKNMESVIIERKTHPYRLWSYNHIVGYIRVSIAGKSMNFNVYLPVEQRQRYRWISSRKIFLYDIHTNGTHFYLGNVKTNENVQRKLAEMLFEIVNKYIPKRYYVDTSAFDSTYRHMDYLSIIQEENSNGET